MLLKPYVSFYAPNRNARGSGELLHYLTFTHWIEASKFDPSVHHVLIEELLLMPSASEVRRFSRKNISYWRSDWQMIRPSKLSLGVAYSYLAGRRSESDSVDVQKAMEQDGLSNSMAKSIIDVGINLSRAKKICVLADPRTTAADFNKKLRSVVKLYEGLANVVCWGGRNGSSLMYEWASSASLPIMAAGARGMRLNEKNLTNLIGLVDHFIIFDNREDRKLDKVIPQVKASGKVLDLVYISTAHQTSELFD